MTKRRTGPTKMQLRLNLAKIFCQNCQTCASNLVNIQDEIVSLFSTKKKKLSEEIMLVYLIEIETRRTLIKTE